MDFGDIVQLIFFGLIFLSFFGGLFGKDKDKKDAQKPVKKAAAPRPRELSQSGGQDRPRPAAATRVEPVPVEVFTGDGASRTEARRRELLERFGDKLQEQRRVAERPEDRLERDLRDTEGELLERDITDMPAITEDLDPERRRRPRRTQVAATRRKHPATGGDVLRGSLKDPDTLERAFIVKEVLDRPLSLRGDR